MKKDTTNFESNIRVRAEDLYETNRIDYNTLYSLVLNRFSRIDDKFKYLSNEQRVIFVNNVLIFAFTDTVLKAGQVDTDMNITDAILAEVIDTDEYRQTNMYPVLAEGTDENNTD